MLELIKNAYIKWLEINQAAWTKLEEEMAEFAKLVLSLRGLTFDPLRPGLPRVVWAAADLLFLFLDTGVDVLGINPWIAVGNALLDNLKLNKKLRQRVMTLDQVATAVVRTLVVEGINRARDPFPTEWRLFTLTDRARKFESLLKGPTVRRLWRFFFGSLWTRLIRIGLVVIAWVKLAALFAVLWNYIKALQDPRTWPVLFSAALRQDNPRQTVLVSIERRIGGVPP